MAEVQERRQVARQASPYADVAVELTGVTFRGLLPTVLLSGAGLAGTTALLASHYRDRWLWLFTALIGILSALRAGLVVAFQFASRNPLSMRAAMRWQWFNAVTTLLYCVSMAGCTFYCFRAHDATAWTLCTLGTFMLCAGQASRVGLYPRFLQAGGVIMLLALALAVVSSPDGLTRIGILLVCLFGLAYFQSVQNRFDSVVDQIRSRRTLSLLSEHDTLTGLTNRHRFETILATTCRLEEPFAILFIDIDQLHRVNDAHGQAVGDIVLQRVAVRLKNSVRRGDIVARIGGDEFAILQVAGASQESAESLSRRIIRAIAAPFEIDGRQVLISTSISVRLSTPEDTSPDSLFDASYHVPYAPSAGNGGAASAPAGRTA